MHECNNEASMNWLASQTATRSVSSTIGHLQSVCLCVCMNVRTIDRSISGGQLQQKCQQWRCRNWFDELLSTCCTVFWSYGLGNYFSGCRGGRLTCTCLISASLDASGVASSMQVCLFEFFLSNRLLFLYSICINLIIMPVKTDSNWSGLSPPPPPPPADGKWLIEFFLAGEIMMALRISCWDLPSYAYSHLHIYIQKHFW